MRQSFRILTMFHYWTDGTPKAHVFSFQLAWLLSEAVQGAADAHELFRVAKRVRSGNSRDWHDAFKDMGRRVQGIADEAAEAGHDATASAAYFRAFTYFRSAERILPGSDERKPAFYRTAMSCYANGMRLSEHTCQNIEFPYESHRLAGLFFPPRLRIKDHPPPCVIFLSGADALPEENFFRGIQYVTARGAASTSCVQRARTREYPAGPRFANHPRIRTSGNRRCRLSDDPQRHRSRPHWFDGS